MEYLSSSENPNNQDSLPAETLQAQEANTGRAQAEAQSSNTETDEGDLELRTRKKQKVETGNYQAQIDKLEQEIAEVQQRLASPHQSSTKAAWELGKSCIEMKQIAANMRRKLAEHAHWLQRVGSLLETAPLFDYAAGLNKKQNSEQAGGDCDCDPPQDLDEWRRELKPQSHPRVILDERVRAAVVICEENAARILHDAFKSDSSFNLPMKFESHGWTIATGVLLNDHMGFLCHRMLPVSLKGKANLVATTLWNSVERDEIFRTFVPLVQDSIITHQEAESSLSCRVLQLSQEMHQQVVATVESIKSTRNDDGEEISWQISIEAVHDHYLCTFAADASGDSVIQNAAPPIKHDLGLQMSKLNMHNKFVMGARVATTDEGVHVLIAGSGRLDLPCYSDPAFDLLQHFVSHMPVYEDLHLTPLGESNDMPTVEEM